MEDDRKRLLLVVNPVAGTTQIKDNLLEVIDVFNKANYEVTVRATQRAGEIKDIIDRHNFDYNIIVCTGGDGTLNEAVNGMMELKLPPVLGYIPAGTVNDFATSNGISKNPVQAAKQLVNSLGRYYDIGRIIENNKAFVYVAAFGIFTNVPYITSQQSKNILGRLAYGLEGIKQLSQIKSYNLEITTDTKHIKGEYMLGMVTNSRSVGGIELPMFNESKYDDGIMEVSLVKTPKNIQELNMLIQSILNSETSPLLEHFTTSNIVIKSDSNMDWTVDGEHGITSDICSIEVLRNKVKILV